MSYNLLHNGNCKTLVHKTADSTVVIIGSAVLKNTFELSAIFEVLWSY